MWMLSCQMSQDPYNGCHLGDLCFRGSDTFGLTLTEILQAAWQYACDYGVRKARPKKTKRSLHYESARPRYFYWNEFYWQQYRQLDNCFIKITLIPVSFLSRHPIVSTFKQGLSSKHQKRIIHSVINNFIRNTVAINLKTFSQRFQWKMEACLSFRTLPACTVCPLSGMLCVAIRARMRWSRNHQSDYINKEGSCLQNDC